jgi:N-methylhydantoinase A/oxoprolinase/acetone carboxylase beta subunit
MGASHPSLLIGADTGGTFTDLVPVRGSRILTHKTPSTPDDDSRGVPAGVRAVRVESGDGGPARSFIRPRWPPTPCRKAAAPGRRA